MLLPLKVSRVVAKTAKNDELCVLFIEQNKLDSKTEVNERLRESAKEWVEKGVKREVKTSKISLANWENV